ncbi:MULTISPECIES: hypothetical protein [Actinomyces]|uniref:Uncharacterized protein n=1 Tax=Actinomyces marmotae TaxID=2737173 RepID=A0A6M8B0R3_9ACTO|nr:MULTISPECIES: hypothetical protein [Actinomyces]QKD80134.1 hypothetical protein HPC72_07820 [Actinomyces marmotae]
MQSPPHRGAVITPREVAALDIGNAKINAEPARAGGAGALGIHAAATAPSAVFALKATPGARGKTLEDIEHEFMRSEA